MESLTGIWAWLAQMDWMARESQNLSLSSSIPSLQVRCSARYQAFTRVLGTKVKFFTQLEEHLTGDYGAEDHSEDAQGPIYISA